MSDNEINSHHYVTRDEFMQWVDTFTERIDDKFDRLDSKFDELGNTLSRAIERIGVTEASKGTIPIGAIALIIGIILSIGSVVGALTVIPMSMDMKEHEALEGHPETLVNNATLMEIARNNREEINRLRDQKSP